MFFNHKIKWITCTGDECSKQNNETCWRGLGDIHVLRTGLRLVNSKNPEGTPKSHTHSGRGLFSVVCLMSKARALIALKCSRGFSKRCAFLPWDHRWNYFYTCTVTKSQQWGHSIEIRGGRPSQSGIKVDSPRWDPQVPSAGSKSSLGHRNPRWIIRVLQPSLSK